MSWANQNSLIELSEYLKHPNLPLDCIKKIMESTQSMNTIAEEAAVLFGQACEMFILDLTRRSWAYTQQNHCCCMGKREVVAALSGCETFDFLSCLAPREEDILDMAF